MKGFIEVNEPFRTAKILININHIVSVYGSEILLSGNEYALVVQQTYDEIKQLIIDAQ